MTEKSKKQTKGWSEERRRKQAERIRANKPWERSTGPKTQSGKARSSQNGFKHGLYAAETRALRKILRAQGIFTKQLILSHAATIRKINEERRTNKKLKKINLPPPPPPELFKVK